MPDDLSPTLPPPAARVDQAMAVEESEPFASVGSRRPDDILYHLWFEQFKQINTLSVAATGGALILLQMDFVEAAVVSGGAILAMATAVLVAMHGQNMLVQDVADGVPPGMPVRAARGIAGALLAGGAGAFISFGYFG